MNPEDANAETCIVCGKDVTAATNAAHLYHKGRRFALCCPMCVQFFQRAPDRFAAGERPQSIVEDLLADIKWKETGRW
ncbi:MAG TPA: hypothetical protein PKX00_08805 [Opitutaceae bacterium]|jgi:hypothetical protein|nr:hypothetical protein [Lacunisphaera sp.]HRE05695.1 hypothetical protein [Opitutaceae bacterium]